MGQSEAGAWPPGLQVLGLALSPSVTLSPFPPVSADAASGHLLVRRAGGPLLSEVAFFSKQRGGREVTLTRSPYGKGCIHSGELLPAPCPPVSLSSPSSWGKASS